MATLPTNATSGSSSTEPRTHCKTILGASKVCWQPSGSGCSSKQGRVTDKAKIANAVSDPDELQLVEFGAMDEELAVKAIASHLRDGCEDGLFAAGRRLAFLFGQQDNEGSLPVEELIVEALDGAFVDMGLASPARLEVLRCVEHYAVDIFGPAIHDLNAFLVGRGVLPRLRRSYVRTSAEKKPTSEGDQAADIFALLQKLVAAQPAGGVAGGVSVGAGGGSGVVGSGSGQGGGVPASMVVAMEQVMASLDTLQRVVPVQNVGAPTANVLREFRTSDTGQNLGYLDAVTVDIVATLFDFIFDDASVADPIKALVARLQIPVLKVAMLDKTFFSSKSHPARRLLDGLSRAAVRCGPQAGHDDPLYVRIAEIVDRLQNEFSQDTGLFDTLCVDLNDFLDDQEHAADARAAQAAPLVAEQERRELANLAVDEALAGWLAMPLPSAISDLLAHEWRALLIRHYLAADDAAWGSAMGTVSDLVASVQPQTQAQGRKQLATWLPTLVRRIHDGLDSLKVVDDRRLALIDALFSLACGGLARRRACRVTKLGRVHPRLRQYRPRLPANISRTATHNWNESRWPTTVGRRRSRAATMPRPRWRNFNVATGSSSPMPRPGPCAIACPGSVRSAASCCSPIRSRPGQSRYRPMRWYCRSSAAKRSSCRWHRCSIVR